MVFAYRKNTFCILFFCAHFLLRDLSGVSKTDKLLAKVLSGSADANLSFDDVCYLLQKLGAEVRPGKGSHVLFFLDGALINLQNAGGQAKAYQVAQIRDHLKSKRGY